MAEVAALGLKVDGVENIDKATDSLGRFAQAGDKAERKAGAFGKGATKAGSDASKANNQAANTADKLSASYGSVNRSVLLAAKGILALTGAAVGFAASSRTLANFEQSMSSVQAVSRATLSEMSAMRDMAKELGATTEFSASQAADGLKFLGMAGFSASESIAAIPAVLDLATASSMGLSEAADVASNIMSGFGIAANEAASVADVLAAAATRSNTTVQQLGGAMSTVAPISSALGINLADTAAAIGLMSDAGIQGERAGTALRGVLASLAGPTKDAQKVLAQLGLTVKDVNPETNELSEVFGKLRDAGISTSDAMRIFGREAASGALVLVEGSERLGEFGGLLRDVDGEAARVADTMRDNLAGDLMGAQSAVEGLIIALGDAGLTNVLRAGAQQTTNMLRAMTSLVNRLVEAGNTVSTMFKPAIDALSPVFRTIANYSDIAVAAIAGFYAPVVIGGIALLTKSLAVGLVGAIKAVTVAMMANPIGLLTAAIVGAGYALWKFRDDIQQIIGVDVVEVAKQGANGLIGSFVAAYENIKFVWNNFGNMMGAAVIGGVNIAIDAINKLIRGALSGINSLIDAVNATLGVNIGAVGGGLMVDRLTNNFAQNLNNNVKALNQATSEAMAKDYVGAVAKQFKLAKADRTLADLSVELYENDPYKNPTDSAKKLTNAVDDATNSAQGLNNELSKAGGGGGGSQAINQNIQAINRLEQSLYLASLRGEELAIAQARMSLNEYATPEQVAQVEALASALYQVQEEMKRRDAFGVGADADKYILGDNSLLSGGLFDNQYARYEAEAEAERIRYQEQLERLIEARELQIETQLSYDELEAQAAQQHADRMAQIEQAKTDLMLSTASDAFGAMADIVRQSHGEQSGIYKAMFAASKAFAVANATMNAYDAISKAWASAPFPANLAAVAATAPQVMKIITAVKGTNLAGMAHDGIDSIPETGTWLLEKGERVVTANTSAKLDSVLERIDAQHRIERAGGNNDTAVQNGITVNLIENPDRAGQVVERTNDNGERDIEIFVADIMGDGKRARALERAYGLQRVGA